MQSFQQGPIFGNITFLDKQKCIIKGNISDNVKNGKIRYFAASPMDKITSFSGAGLPFPNAEVAFESTPNQGEIELERENAFEISLLKPNSYYVHMGATFVPPSVYIRYNNGDSIDQIVAIQVAHPIPFRSLNYPAQRDHKGAMFYGDTQFSEKKYSIRTQEEILRDSAYRVNDIVPDNFWGKRPPV